MSAKESGRRAERLRPAGMVRRDSPAGLWPAGVITLAYVLLFAWVSPRYEVPQNDDWAYFLTVQHWFQTGRLTHLGWNDPTLVFQILFGGLFARLFGLSYTSLRWSTLVLSWLGVVSLYQILRHCGASRGASLLGAGILFANPMFLTLSYSFNTDVPYLGLSLFATWVFLWALAPDPAPPSTDRRRPPWIRFFWTGLVLAGAFLIRQQGAVLAAGAAAVLALRFRRRAAAPAAALLAPVLAAAAAHAVWFHRVTGGAWPWNMGNIHPFFHDWSWAGLRDLALQLLREGAAGTLGLAVPAIAVVVAGAAGGWRELRRRPLRIAGLALSILLLAAASFWLMQDQRPRLRGWPYQGNYITRSGTLPTSAGPAWLLPAGVWKALTWIAPVLAGWLVLTCWLTVSRALREGRLERGDRPASGPDGSPAPDTRPIAGATSPPPPLWSAAVVLGLGLLQLAASLVTASVYDRYFLVALPALAVGAICWTRMRRPAVAAGLVALAATAFVAAEWTRSYVDQSRACWEVAEDAVKAGVRPEEIQLNFEWEGAHLYLEALDKLGARPPFRLDRGYPWAPLLAPHYSVGARAGTGGTIVAEREYRPFLGRAKRMVAVVR